MPAAGVHLASGLARGRPLALVEVGASAGLNLPFDRYDYGDGVVRGEAGSSVRISCSLRAARLGVLPTTVSATIRLRGLSSSMRCSRRLIEACTCAPPR